MAHDINETITFGLCDPGTIDANFMDGIFELVFWAKKNQINIDGRIRVNGNQIARQRQVVFDTWADGAKTDWLLWIDSDIVLTPEAFKLIWDVADKDTKPVVSGVYFISQDNEQSLMRPYPAIFKKGKSKYELDLIHPLPKNEIMKIDAAGFGFLLMHKSIVPKIRKINPDYSVFAEEQGLGEKFVSEDIAFFRNLAKTGTEVYSHTGAVVKHIKRFAYDYNYYSLYWSGLDAKLFYIQDQV